MNALRIPVVSVVIPAYNAETTIRGTIQSVLDQTIVDFEIIVIDDGSTDNTRHILDSINDSRLKIFSYANGGLSTARNRGLHHATGEFIAFLDADDQWTSDKLEAQLASLMANPWTDVAYSWTIYFFADCPATRYPSQPIFFQGNVFKDMLLTNFIANGSNILVRRSVAEKVGGFDVSLMASEDWDYYIRLAAIAQFSVVPKHQILYRQSRCSMASNTTVMEQESLKVIAKAFASAPPDCQHLRRKSEAWVYQYCAQQYLKSARAKPDLNPVIRCLKKAILLDPFILKTGYALDLMQWTAKTYVRTSLPQISYLLSFRKK